jgi:hypothetical protein
MILDDLKAVGLFAGVQIALGCQDWQKYGVVLVWSLEFCVLLFVKASDSSSSSEFPLYYIRNNI